MLTPHKDYTHEPGNNYLAKYIKRIPVKLYNTATATISRGQFYLPEEPEIEKRNVVGIGVEVYVPGDQGQMPRLSASEAQFGIVARYADLSEINRYFLTLYNQDNEIILSQFPLSQIMNTEWYVSDGVKGKIMPFDSKIKMKESFLWTPNPAAVPQNCVVAITFYCN